MAKKKEKKAARKGPKASGGVKRKRTARQSAKAKGARSSEPTRVRGGSGR